MWRAEAYTIFALSIFGAAVLGLIILISVGTKSNEKKHLEEFLKLKVSEKKQRAEEEKQKQLQKEEYERNMKNRSLVASSNMGASQA